MSSRRALRDDFAAVHAGARADVDDVVGVPDRLLVVLDDDHRVAEVAQARQRAEQALVVALVQADRRLVEDVHHADQAGADLGRQADALRLAAGQRVGAAIERQVVEADVEQEAQALADLLDDLVGDLAAPARELQLVEERAARRRPAGRVTPAATCSATNTLRAARLRRVPPHSGQGWLLRYFASSSRTAQRFGFAIAPLQVRDDAFERVRDASMPRRARRRSGSRSCPRRCRTARRR